MLEFVHLTGDGAGKDLQTRRKVRSQAMRDFRRRQRAERDAAQRGRSKSSSAACSSTPSPRLQSCDQFTPDVGASSKAVFRRTSVQETRGKTMQSATNQPLFSVMPLTTPPTLQSSSSSPPLSGQRMRHPQPRHHRAPSDSVQRQTSRSQNPSPAQQEDPFESPAQIGQMLRFCKSYLHWLQPYADDETLNRMVVDAWEESKSPMLLAACCLASVGHLDAVQPNRPNGNYGAYKGRILRELSQRMQSPTSATSDETIGTLACLMSFEMSKGSTEATTHLRGLANVVSIRGGLDSVGFNGRLAMMVECLDLIHANMYDSKPLIAQADPGTLARISDFTPEISDVETLERLLPLLVAEHEQLQGRYHTACSTQLQPLSELWGGAVAALRGVSFANTTQDFILYGPDPIAHFRERLDAFGQLTGSAIDDADDARQLARACHLSLVLFYNLAINKVPYRHISNQQNVRMLCEATRHVKDHAWHGLVYLRLWILVTGIAASTEQDVRSFLKAQLIRASHNISVDSSWRRAKHFLLRFGEMRSSLERPSRRATPPIDDFIPSRSSGAAALLWPSSGRKSSSSLAGSGAGLASLPFLTPYLSRAPSPTSHAESTTDGKSASRRSTPYDEVRIDPFLASTAGSEREAATTFYTSGQTSWQAMQGAPNAALANVGGYSDQLDLWLSDCAA